MKRDTIFIRFPESGNAFQAQDEEYCIVEREGQERRIRLHDYQEIYAIPGLYEALFCKRLRYRSHKVMASLLVEEILRSSVPLSEISALDMGAGNGLAGEALKRLWIRSLIGIDLFPEAAEAAERDRPGLYDHYHVADLLDLSPATRRALEAGNLNCLISVGALGFSDIPPLAFAAAYNLIADEGWMAFNIKESFMKEGDDCGFSTLIRQMVDQNVFAINIKHRYCHRLTVAGKELFYLAVIGIKKGSVPIAWVEGGLP
jgi:predicted TPR repeat methyltransferase